MWEHRIKLSHNIQFEEDDKPWFLLNLDYLASYLGKVTEKLQNGENFAPFLFHMHICTWMSVVLSRLRAEIHNFLLNPCLLRNQ